MIGADRLHGMSEPASALAALGEEIQGCVKCARLITYCREIARAKEAGLSRPGVLGQARPRIWRSPCKAARDWTCARRARGQPDGADVHRKLAG